MKTYKVVIFQERGFMTILLGAGKIDPIKFADFLNSHAKDGWRVVTVEKEIRRAFLFWRREAMVCILEKDA